MKKISLILFVTLVVELLTGCDFLTGVLPGNGGGSGTNQDGATISKEYWGTWIRMDTGDEYVISDKTVTVNGRVTSGIGVITKESDLVLKYGTEDEAPRLFKKGGVSRDFSFRLSGFESSSSYRAAGIGSVTTSGRGFRKNKTNPSDVETVDSDSTGKINFTNAVPEDIQEITIQTSTGSEVKVDVVPQYDGEDMGTIPVVEKSKYALKTTYTIDTKLEDYMYGNNYAEYDITISIENISNVKCSTSFYSITCDDSNFILTGIEKEGNIRTLKSGDSKKLYGKVSYGNLFDEYKDVVVKIKIEDGTSVDAWNDSITLRFYRGRVPLVVNAKVIDGTTNAKLNGFVVYPDGRSKWFCVNSGETGTVWMPSSNSDYTLVFSGATTASEMKYSFNFRNPSKLADLSGILTREELRAYESNDKLDTAYNLGTFSTNIKAALSYGDLDYFKINNKNELIGNLASIEVDSSAMRTNYYLNQSLDTSGLVVKAVYQGGQKIDVSNSIKIGSIDMTTIGTKSLDISYTEDGITKSEKIYITVSDFTATSIAIAQKPSKLIYYTEQEFDPSGIKVNATATDGETIDVTNSVEYEGFNNTRTGTQTITVILENNGSRFRNSFDIEMRQLVLESIRIDSKPAKTKYYTGQKIRLDGLKVTALYNSGEEKDCTEKVEVIFDSANATDSYPVTVKYTENGITKTATFNVIINSLPNNFTNVPVKITDPEITKNLSLGTEGEYYYFGDWPQSRVDNPPVNEEDGPAYFDWYIGDDGNFYAKVVAKGQNSYTDALIYDGGTPHWLYQEGKTYWFKVEPIKWRVLTKNYNSTSGELLLAENIIGEEHWKISYKQGVGHSGEPYRNGKIRAFLNGTTYEDWYQKLSNDTTKIYDTFVDKGFLQIAFTNSARNKLKSVKLSDVSETADKVFLLNSAEVSDSSFGFDVDKDGASKVRTAIQRCDYARAYITCSSYYYEYQYWWLRDGMFVEGHWAVSGVIRRDSSSDGMTLGIVPAICIDLK